MQWKQKEAKLNYKKNDSMIKKLACINGIHDVKTFIDPKVSALNDPYLLTNIEEACMEIIKAIQTGKKISVFADVDADGEFSAALTFNYLKQLTDNVEYFYTQRSQGHGIRNGVDAIPKGTELLIIVDSSTNDSESCEKLLECGIKKIIIIDHHLVEEVNKYALIVNPQLDNDKYPNKEISGSVVCWKVCQVLDDMLGTSYSEDLVDLAGFGLVSDVMSMFEMENRYIVSTALDNITNVGLLAIIHANQYLNLFDLNTKDIGFSVTPLLNAVARMDKIEIALELLTTDDKDRAFELAKEMMELNETRKTMQTSFMAKFAPQVNREDNIIVIVDDSIGKGFSGVVAGDMASLYQRPVAILRKTQGRATLDGSFRGYGGIKLKTFFSGLPFDFKTMEGHEGAGGIAFEERDLAKFINLANEELSKISLFEETAWYDLEIDSNQVTETMLHDIAAFNRLAGRDIPEAKFLVKNLFPEEKKVMGKDKSSLKVTCSNGVNLMKFRTNKLFISDFPLMLPMEAVGGMNLNVWEDWRKKKTKTTQIIMDDYKLV